jgi:muramoyltetrapeptide carboxypeptidase LdcA involved in peptidoglycan recycling
MTSDTSLKPGDEIRIIAPSLSREPGYEQRDERAKQRLESLGYSVTFSTNIDSQYHLGTAAAEDRAKDFHNAFADKNVKAIMAYSGGWAANELLPLIDWDLVRANPKPLIGFSDITVLVNALYAQAGTVSYLGPGFGTIGEIASWQYTLENFNNVVQHKLPFEIKPSEKWSASDEQHYQATDWQVLQEGEAEAVLIGGNFNTFHLLQGTEYQPQFNQPFILMAEDDDESGKLTPRYFSRRLESILQLPEVRKNLKGIIIGRFLPSCHFSSADLKEVIASKQLGNIPIVAGVDFGHTLPILTLPVGGVLMLSAKNDKISMKMVKILASEKLATS